MSAGYTVILEQLTGPRRGSETRLFGEVIYAFLEADQNLRFTDQQDLQDRESEFAVLNRSETDYIITATADNEFWINKRLVKSASLRGGDMIEFGENGPMVRYHHFDGVLPLRWTVSEIAGDTIAYLRFSRKPFTYRLRHAAAQFGGRLVWQTTIAYRVTVVVAILALAGLAYSQYHASRLLQERIEAGAGQLDSVAASLAKARDEALKPSDLVELRNDLSSQVSLNAERLAELERHSEAVKRVIRTSTEAVAFLQLEYSLRDIVTGNELRHVMNRDGVPVMLPRGQPLLSLDGNGPVATVQLTGTGFLLGGGRYLATNRHVALPWERGRYSGPISADVLEPVISKFIAYFPNLQKPVEVSLQTASETADLAILAIEAGLPELGGLPLASETPSVGEEVILLGYPTGLRSLLAQSGHEFVRQLEADKELDFWNVSRRLSDAGLIFPLASRGITARVASEALVYDAETTMGGSGGPVLNLQGEVIAINAAILPEFGGSNLGVPASKLAALISIKTKE
ncbi:S1 family peptidase [Roseovarius sp. CH_XMU1461]|uniref:S1 family peptidase n=1 Tax=Roseovarius sp. CH_XMU1461 TaxID=3107777 RepID=UPI00300B2659